MARTCRASPSRRFQLEHVDASVAAIYTRDQPERTKMMQFWADKIDAGAWSLGPPMRAV
jgi:hypothetical protein